MAQCRASQGAPGDLGSRHREKVAAAVVSLSRCRRSGSGRGGRGPGMSLGWTVGADV